MRLDKWLKVALIFKQRSKAVDAINNNRIRVNGEIAKAARNLKIGDKISISKELGEYIYTVCQILEKNVTREQAREMYELSAPEDKGTDEDKILKKIEKKYRQQNREDWSKMYNNKKKQRQLRHHKYHD